MPKRCTRCGNFLMDDERFCSRCGENVSSIPPEKESINISGQTWQNQSSAMPGDRTNERITSATSHNYNYAPPPSAPVSAEEMTFGKWFVTVLVTQLFGIISLIFMFVWGFGQGPKARQDYCKAMLIITAIRVVLGIIIGIFYISLFGIIINEILAEYPDWQNFDFGDYITSILAVI